MKLEDQVVSLEIAHTLQMLGVKQDSYFYWWKEGYNGSRVVMSKKEAEYYKTKEFHDEPGANDTYDPISAFTVAELGEMLPYDKMSFYADKQWKSSIRDYPVQVADTEADARGKMLIYLLENKLIPSPTERKEV